MSFLAPLYLLGLGAISLPIVLHLIRRMPKGRYAFSSLMFLAPSPPRLTRRSRIDQWLLLLLRALAITLLALAFSRPFWRAFADAPGPLQQGRQVALLVDTSASMRRGDLWEQAVARVRRVVEGLEDPDTVALFTYDSQLRPVVMWPDGLSVSESANRAIILQRIQQEQPRWEATDLGQALLAVGDYFEQGNGRAARETHRQIVVVTDFQRGTDLTALQRVAWPEDLPVALETVSSADQGNATLRVVPAEDESPSDPVRVRVTNEQGSVNDQFHVDWVFADSPAGDQPRVPVYVPAGQSRVVRVPPSRGQQMPTGVRLTGDDCPFDNTWHVAPVPRRSWLVVYLGRDQADDPDQLSYYLHRALTDAPGYDVKIVEQFEKDRVAAPGAPVGHLVVVSRPVDEAMLDDLMDYVTGGGFVLVVPDSDEAARNLAPLTPGLRYREAESSTSDDDYALLADVDYDHPLFAPFQGVRFGDFTKIHFWNRWVYDVEPDATGRPLARFDRGGPALWHETLGDGQMLLLAGTWRPRDSQLALSTKFVPLLDGLLELVAPRMVTPGDLRVGDPVALREGEKQVVLPDGTLVEVVDDQWYRDTREPGIYQFLSANMTRPVAINLARTESQTSALPRERLEQLGVTLGSVPPPSVTEAHLRQLRATELENQQKGWRWLLLTVCGLLVIETWWAGRQARHGMKSLGAQVPQNDGSAS